MDFVWSVVKLSKSDSHFTAFGRQLLGAGACDESFIAKQHVARERFCHFKELHLLIAKITNAVKAGHPNCQGLVFFFDHQAAPMADRGVPALSALVPCDA